MENYIVRIYRRGRKRCEEFLGTIENTETEEKRAFRSGEDFIRSLDVPRVRPISPRSRLRLAFRRPIFAYAAGALAVVCAGLFLLFQPAESSLSSWELEPGARLEGRWPSSPCVIYAGKDKLRMYYNDSYGSDWAHYYPIIIKSATSEDGLMWSIEPGVRLGKDVPGFENWCSGPTIIIVPDKAMYRMFYSSEDNRSIMSAVSVDGLSWTPEGVKIRPDDSNSVRVFTGSVIAVSDDTYRMYYSGYDGSHYKILSAFSGDEGVTWALDSGVRIDKGESGALDDAGCNSPIVVRLESGIFYLFYSGWGGTPRTNRILSAVSKDGLAWEKEAGARLSSEDVPGGPNAFPYGISTGGILHLSRDRFRMYITGDRGTFAPGYFSDNRYVIFSAVGKLRAAN
ncbi:MAG: hypothetical protein FJY82_12775 [Candidatus Aminicenantes bacterium]|nr:hypothetical protein [Candidatus Aminicenantes bacterium]